MNGSTSADEGNGIDALCYWRQNLPCMTDEELNEFARVSKIPNSSSSREAEPRMSSGRNESVGEHFHVKFSTDCLQLNEADMHQQRSCKFKVTDSSASASDSPTEASISDNSAGRFPRRSALPDAFGNEKGEKKNIFLSLEVLEECVVTSEEIVQRECSSSPWEERGMVRSFSVDPIISESIPINSPRISSNDESVVETPEVPSAQSIQSGSRVPKSFSFDSRKTLERDFFPITTSSVPDASASLAGSATDVDDPEALTGLGSFMPHITLKKLRS